MTFVGGFETYSTTVGRTWTLEGPPKSFRWGRHRDSQKTKVYKANWALPPGRRFDSVAEVQEYVDRMILSDPWWRENYPYVRRVVVRRGRAKSKATATLKAGEYTISNMPAWSRCQRYILHELAHLTVADFQHFIPFHGAEFAREFLTLVNQYMGETPAMTLAAQYRKHNVRLAARDYRKVYAPALAPAIIRSDGQVPVTKGS